MELAPEARKILKSLLRSAHKNHKELYVVGGYPRDILLKREKVVPDIDFCLASGAIRFARKFAAAIKAGFVVLDPEHGACRLVKKIAGSALTLDFTDFRAPGLNEDLSHRDFTINAIALKLGDMVNLSPSAIRRKPSWIDPTGGRQDIRRKLIRIANPQTFDEDPLRVLRAFSFSAALGFGIDKKTLLLAGRKKKLLKDVASERIRDEIFRALESRQAFSCIQSMDKCKVLAEVFPEIELMRGVTQGPYHHLDVWKHSLETLKQLEKVLREFRRNKDVCRYLDGTLSSGRSRRALLKLAALFHDTGKPSAKRRRKGKLKFYGHERIGSEIMQGMSQRLKLSKPECAALAKMVFWHLRPGYLADNQVPSERAVFRFFRDANLEAVSVLLLGIADQRSTRGPLTTQARRAHHEKIIFGLICEYFRRKNKIPVLPVVNGWDIMKKFSLSPSPIIGKILREIEEARAIGKIKTKDEAFASARRLLRIC